MTVDSLFFLVAGAALLWQGFQFIANRDHQWARYVERQKGLGLPEDKIIRDTTWERVATIQGILFTVGGAVACLLALS